MPRDFLNTLLAHGGRLKIQNGFSSLKALAPQEKDAKLDSELREAAKMYESHFLNEMVKAMRATVPNEGGLIKAGFAEKLFTEQLDQKYVEGWSKRGGVGLADMIYGQIRDRYMATTKKDFLHSGGMLPVRPKDGGLAPQIKMLPLNNGKQMNYRFELPAGGKTDAPAPVQAPLEGKILDSVSLGDSWNLLRLDHGPSEGGPFVSELTFPGCLSQIGVGDEVRPGQKLGEMDVARPVLAWKLEWT